MRKAAVNALLEQLAKENRADLLGLMAEGIVPSTQQEWLAACGVSDVEFQDLLSRMLAGERPFEDWMHAHGRSDEEIAEVYRLVDRWLMDRGIVPPPPLDPSVN